MIIHMRSSIVLSAVAWLVVLESFSHSFPIQSPPRPFLLRRTTGDRCLSSSLAASANIHCNKDDMNDMTRKRRNKKKRNNQKSSHTQRRNKTKRAAQTWRLFNIEVHPDNLDLDLTKERSIKGQNRTAARDQFLHPAVLESLGRRLPGASALPNDDLSKYVSNVRVVRRSLDARVRKVRHDGGTGPRFVFVLDVDVPPSSTIRFRHQPGKCEKLNRPKTHADFQPDSLLSGNEDEKEEKRVIVVGAGPAGLFCALRLAREPGVTPIVLERGQAVEVRGKDIGALMHRRMLHPESNYAFGEGGAGTWSDGKLTTRIGRNSVAVRNVLETLVDYGAPPWILLDGSPHLGTDNLVRILRRMRLDLRRMGGQIHFGTKVNGFIVQDDAIRGVMYEHRKGMERNIDEEHEPTTTLHDEGVLYGDAVVLASGHSARDVYETLHDAGAKLEPKGFAVGFRIEHPQKIINEMQYGKEWGPSVFTGKQSTDSENMNFFQSKVDATEELHRSHLPVPSYRLATDKAHDGERYRGCFSFCMCPGGQIVPASTDPEEVCVNGMSFSRRDSVWANSALVVTVNPDDPVLDEYKEHGVLAGIAFQRAMERKAAKMGGGDLCVPVQRVTDFVTGRASTTAPPSSYRLGVRPSACHEIYPPALTAALRHALVEYFDRQMPGYVCEDGLLHAVETRTSSPVRVSRDGASLQAIGIHGLFPAGEGAGFAGGIVSAAVDGMAVAEAVLIGVGRETSVANTFDKQRSNAASKTTGNFYY